MFIQITPEALITVPGYQDLLARARHNAQPTTRPKTVFESTIEKIVIAFIARNTQKWQEQEITAFTLCYLKKLKQPESALHQVLESLRQSKRLPDVFPLSKDDQQALQKRIRCIIAGTCISKDKQQQCEKLARCVKHLFSLKQFSTLSKNALFAFLKTHQFDKLPLARLSRNTFDKVISSVLPHHIFTKTRQSKEIMAEHEKKLHLFFGKYHQFYQ